ncbi:uncharacterized protein YqeN [Paraliobacillus ryukyuensis]|uniref:DNA polymerase III subunit delta n=1 Tax=Paraliobacillus ryukyuensis TaxID=200904 RepID=A0A366EIT9_9BACI|nr:DNA polymerase III subunit delta [Paraliobacillus ryukyuensis]RBP01335.1 DNA polymerase III delta subunit [Paraliobacillus ryukyuensis]
MDYFKAMKEIKQQALAPIYLLIGPETYLAENVVNTIRKKATSDTEEENVIRYDLEETAIQEAIMDVETYPFFGETKIVVASNPVFLTAKPDKSGVTHQLDNLLQYAMNPVDYSVLVLIAPYEKLDERKKLTKALKKNATVIECDPVRDWDMDKWMDHLAKQLHIGIEKAAYDVILQEVGSNLMLMEKELEKLAIYVGEGGTVTVDTAEMLLAHQSANTSGLKLVDAVIAKNLAKALRIYQDLARMNEDEIALVALLASQFRTINHVKTLKKTGYSQKQMAQQLKVHPYVIKMAMTRENYFSREQLEGILNQCAITDAQVKQGRMDKRLAFELLLYQIIRPTAS